MKELSLADIDRIIQMCWEDRTPFEAIKEQFDLSEGEIICVMRNNLKKSSFIRWRKRIDNRKTKHSYNSKNSEYRFKSKSQKQISLNKLK